jgi:hypothetical protein
VKLWSLTLTEEYRLRVFENRALRENVIAKRQEVTGKWWRKQHMNIFVVGIPHKISFA